MRQRIRRIIIFISLLIFPLTLNYFSPYVSIDGAFKGIVSGSVLVFLVMFLSGMLFGRAWCSWVCPVAGLSELCMTVNNKQVSVRRLRIIRYSIFTVWFAVLISGFVFAGGIKGVNPLHLTENVITVDEPLKYITYYMVLFIFFGLTMWIGKRGACHTICWMSPFLVGGYLFGKKLNIPQLRIRTNPSGCIDCKKCNYKCPMSIDVNSEVKSGEIKSLDCIICCECVDVCPKRVLEYGIRKKLNSNVSGSVHSS
jgi:ferredoxin-type protein NapH